MTRYLHTMYRITDCMCRRFPEALFRTRTGDPLLTMEVLYQLS
jgi:hypothetical protein